MPPSLEPRPHGHRITITITITTGPNDPTTATRFASAPPNGLFPQALGADWELLHPTLQAAHTVGDGGVDLNGTFDVEWGRHPLARVLCTLMRMPAAGSDVPIHARKTREGGGERWDREIGKARICTVLHPAGPGSMFERAGLIEFCYHLEVVEGALKYLPGTVALRAGPLRLPVPRVFAPVVSAEEKAMENGTMLLDMRIGFPGNGLVIRYGGELKVSQGRA